MRDVLKKREVPLESYRLLQEPRNADEEVMRRIISALSCRFHAALTLSIGTYYYVLKDLRDGNQLTAVRPNPLLITSLLCPLSRIPSQLEIEHLLTPKD